MSPEKPAEPEGIKIAFTCEDYCELLKGNQERRRQRRKQRHDKRGGPFASTHPHLTIRTITDPGGDRLPGDPLSVAADLAIGTDGKPRVEVFNFGHLPSFATIVEFLTLPTNARRLTSNTQPLAASLLPSIPPRQSGLVTCPTPLLLPADVILIARAWSIDDPPLSPIDWGDRHLGQNKIGWRKSYAGTLTRYAADPTWNGQQFDARVELEETSPGTGSVVRIRIFLPMAGGLPANPQIDRTLPSTSSILELASDLSFVNEKIRITYIDHRTIRYFAAEHFTDVSGRPDLTLEGILDAGA